MWLLAGLLLGQPAWAQGAGECRPVRHAMGESCVPASPARVVVLDTGELDMALALGVVPIAATTAYQADGFADYLPVGDPPPHSLGVIQEPDLERLLRLSPDLILGSRQRHGRLYPLLSRLAPSVFSETLGADWEANFRLFAEALGREGEAERFLARLDARCQRIARFAERLGHPEIALVRSMQTHVRLYLADSFAGSLLARCGLARPEAQSGPGPVRQLANPRDIRALDGDLILLSEYAPGQGSMIRRWRASPFWSLIEGRVHEVDDDYWMLGIGPLAAEHALTELERILREAYEHH